MSRIGIIANPYSKLNRRNPRRLLSLKKLIGDEAKFIVTQSLDDLDNKVKYLSENDYDVIGICGGDGTISRTLTSIVTAYEGKQLPKIAVFRGGTMNLVASQMRIRGSQFSVIRRFLKKVKKGDSINEVCLSTLKVEDKIGFLYADGSSVRILEEFYKKKSGLIGATWLAVKLISSFLVRGPLIKNMIQSETISAHLDKKKISLESLGNFAGTISKLPLGFPLLPLARKKKGHFQATFITTVAEKLLWHLPAIMLKHQEGSSLGKYSACCKDLEIRSNRRIHFTLDGEIFHSNSPLKIETGPVVHFLEL